MIHSLAGGPGRTVCFMTHPDSWISSYRERAKQSPEWLTYWFEGKQTETIVLFVSGKQILAGLYELEEFKGEEALKFLRKNQSWYKWEK